MRSLNLEYSNAVLRHGILDKKPFMAGRYGLTEATLMYYTGIKKRVPSDEIYRRLSWGVGLFPVTKRSIAEFMDAQMQGASMADAMLVWNKHSWEEELFKTTVKFGAVKLHRKVMSAPFLLKQPWTDALAGRHVLVVHPFAETIAGQESKQKELGILPRFGDFDVIEAPMTIGPQRDGTWSAELDGLQKTISESSFDVALVACGGYGMPLAGYIRARGGKVIVVGGTLQLYFGIKGRRWDCAGLYNDHWVRPSAHEHPTGYKKVEGGCYW